MLQCVAYGVLAGLHYCTWCIVVASRSKNRLFKGSVNERWSLIQAPKKTSTRAVTESLTNIPDQSWKRDWSFSADKRVVLRVIYTVTTKLAINLASLPLDSARYARDLQGYSDPLCAAVICLFACLLDGQTYLYLRCHLPFGIA